ncbi:hypothetical protein [Bacillus solimangrovi]|uniref:Uncharacterized protein n=1 Tax=Bacillus solimangrovi TaxID=1305675 RepID=A0A1E5LJX5_9BACI|nr:hypothetical protein [Bacillus solimangrovi]OEH94390.1 hypothetical protein BFG57_07965 [Bacillus solimangrovi]
MKKIAISLCIIGSLVGFSYSFLRWIGIGLASVEPFSFYEQLHATLPLIVSGIGIVLVVIFQRSFKLMMLFITLSFLNAIYLLIEQFTLNTSDNVNSSSQTDILFDKILEFSPTVYLFSICICFFILLFQNKKTSQLT